MPLINHLLIGLTGAVLRASESPDDRQLGNLLLAGSVLAATLGGQQ